MGRLSMVLIAVALLAGCRGLPPVPPPSPVETRRLRAELDRAWESAREVLTEQGYVVRRQDRAAGVLETDWFPINPEYSASLLFTEQEDRYSECDKPGLGQAFRGKEVRVRLEVSPSVSRGETAVTVRATFRTKQYVGVPMAAGNVRAMVFCRSTGWLENELAVRIQVQALGGLDRLRRGGSR
ncbi:MAG: hypothetical protein ACE147_01585 [Candidatus Methylomirabilales bacterium]